MNWRTRSEKLLYRDDACQVHLWFFLSSRRGRVGGGGGLRFCRENPNPDFRIQKRILRFLGANPKTAHEFIKSRLRADSSDQIQIRIFEVHNLSVFLGQDLKKVFLTSGSSKKEMVRDGSRTCMTLQLNLCWWRLIFKSPYLSFFLYVCSPCLRRFIFQVIKKTIHRLHF